MESQPRPAEEPQSLARVDGRWASVLDADQGTSRYAAADAALSKDQFGGQGNVPWDFKPVKGRKWGKLSGCHHQLFMMFGGKLAGEEDHYHTWAEAERGHAAMVKRVKASVTAR
jgi:hypothetical protein